MNFLKWDDLHRYFQKKMPLFILWTVIAAIRVFLSYPSLNPLYADGAFFWAVQITGYIVIYVVVTFWEHLTSRLRQMERLDVFYLFSGLKMPRKLLLILILPWVYLVVMTAVSSPIISFRRYRSQLGETETHAFSNDMQVVDLSRLPIVDKELAEKLADKKLGERPSLGSQVYTGEPVLQTVNGELVWAVPLFHSGVFKWLANIGGSPGYIRVSATNLNDVEYIGDYLIKYQPSAYLMDNLYRKARLGKGLFRGIADYSFELDETGRPYWVITTYENQAGFALPEANGVILMDAETGKMKRYALDEVPEWVDRIQPENFIMNQINHRGEYIHGIFNFSNRDKYQTSEGDAIIYNNGRCYLMTGITSVGSDESAIGFMMVDMRTKQSSMYEMAGATEYSAQRSAEGKVQHLNYSASFPIIININGQPTYFMTLKDKEGLVKQYAMVYVVNYSTVGTGETIAAALQDYQRALNSDNSFTMELSGSLEKLSGYIDRIAAEYDGSGTVYKMTLEGRTGEIFRAEAELSDQLAISRSGDEVELQYYEGTDGSRRCAAFENRTISGN